MRQSETNLLSEMKEELQFEKLLIEISTHFVNLPAERIDDEIKEAQHRICEYLDLDRSALWQFSNKEPGKVLLTHVHQPPEARLPDENLDAKQAFPWVLDQVLRKGIVAFSSPSDLPSEAARDLESFQDWGVRSGVVVPLSIGGKIVGALSFARLRRERDWPVYVIERFLIVARVFANALVRKQAEESVKERLEFESLLADISTRFVNLPAEQIDSEIEDAHRRVCECFGLDFSALWQLSIESPRNYALTHSYRLIDGPALPERMTADEYFPWCLEHVGAGEVIAVSTEDLPAEAGPRSGSLAPLRYQVLFGYPALGRGRAANWCSELQHYEGGTHLAGTHRKTAYSWSHKYSPMRSPESTRTLSCARAKPV